MVLERDREALAEADAAEWEARHVVIEKQAEEARREKQRRRAQAEVERRSQVRLSLWYPQSMHCSGPVNGKMITHDGDDATASTMTAVSTMTRDGLLTMSH